MSKLEANLVYVEFQDGQGYIEKPCFNNNQTIDNIKQEVWHNYLNFLP